MLPRPETTCELYIHKEKLKMSQQNERNHDIKKSSHTHTSCNPSTQNKRRGSCRVRFASHNETSTVPSFKSSSSRLWYRQDQLKHFSETSGIDPSMKKERAIRRYVIRKAVMEMQRRLDERERQALPGAKVLDRQKYIAATSLKFSKYAKKIAICTAEQDNSFVQEMMLDDAMMSCLES